MINIFNYIERNSPIHKLTGATKLIVMLLWSLGAMITYDTRILAIMPIISFFLFAISKIRLKDVSFMIGFTLIFMLLNNILIFLFSPTHGVSIYGSSHEVFSILGPYVITWEQLFYHLNLVLKYLSTIPIVLLFICTTHPSEFAASLNKIGVPYSIAYAVSLSLRYIPDIQREYHDIAQAQQARGLEMSKKAPFFKRLKNGAAILMPLIMLSIDKIEVISNAMELRSFGQNKKRTWYTEGRFTKWDIVAITLGLALVVASFVMNYVNGGRFWNPFIR